MKKTFIVDLSDPFECIEMYFSHICHILQICFLSKKSSGVKKCFHFDVPRNRHICHRPMHTHLKTGRKCADFVFSNGTYKLES